MVQLASICLLGGLLLSATTFAKPVPGAISRSTSNALRQPFHKRTTSRKTKRKADNSVTAALANDAFTYDIEVQVGNPPQSVLVQLDTGSSDFWVPAPNSCDNDVCQCPDAGCSYFDITQSSTAQLINGTSIPFNITYGGGAAEGYYFLDTISVGNASLPSFVCEYSTTHAKEPEGILGVGLPQGETGSGVGFPVHNGVVGALYSAGYTKSQSFSLYLNDYAASSGEVIFGGIDTSLFSGDLVTLPAVQSPSGVPRLDVAWTSLDITLDGTLLVTSTNLSAGALGPYISGSSINSTSLDAGLPTVLDSGTTFAELPTDIFTILQDIFLAETLSGIGSVVACAVADWDAVLTFGFGDGAVYIDVLAPQFVRPFPGSGDPTGTGKYCQFGFGPGGDGEAILGDTFLTSAYTYYDFDNSEVGLAQAIWTVSSAGKATPSQGTQSK